VAFRSIFLWVQRLGIGSLLLLSAAWAERLPNDQFRTALNQRMAAASNSASSANGNCDNASSATFLAVGDIMLSRGVSRAIVRSKNALLPFSKLSDEFQSTDFNFGNLEAPISGENDRMAKGLVFNTRTDDAAGLRKSNFRLVSLANNHALDQGLNGLRFTTDFLTKLGILYVGAGNSLDEAWEPKVIEANGIKIAFLAASYSSVNDGGGFRNEYVARVDDRERLIAAISKAKGESDLVIVSMHAGIEYTWRPRSEQIAFAHAAIDAGANLIIGGHPHRIQTLENYNGRYIFYSLGNFIFDHQGMQGTDEGLMLKVHVDREGCTNSVGAVKIGKIELIPVIIESGGIPRRANENESKAILDRVFLTEAVLTP
jgi:gamma-polyglutamate biosynthesis protein CapA